MCPHMTLPFMNEIITDSIPIIAIMQTYRMAIPKIKKRKHGVNLFTPIASFLRKLGRKPLVCSAEVVDFFVNPPQLERATRLTPS